MFIKFLLFIARILLSLRYKVKISGIDEVLNKGNKGILLLPNHPALMDPIILLCYIFPYFKQRTLGDKDQVSRPVIKYFARLFGVLALPDPTKYGNEALKEVERVIDKCGDVLKKGKNIVLYPAGHIKTERMEYLGGNSAVEIILKDNNETRVVLIRTRGLWGSSWSRSNGLYPSVSSNIKHGLKVLFFNFLFFTPRRNVEIEFFEPEDFPKQRNRLRMNRYIENFFNENPPYNTYVPYFWFESGNTRIVLEPKKLDISGDMSLVPDSVRKIVLDYFKEISDKKNIKDFHKLSGDLGLDSLKRVGLALWLEEEFGFNISNPDSLKKVSDVMLVASGQTLGNQVKLFNKVNSKWFDGEKYTGRASIIKRENIQKTFLEACKGNYNKVVIADQLSGVKTFRNIITGIYALKKEILQNPQKYIGIMLPASVTAVILYFTVLFAGKTPVMINWTVGERSIKHSIELLGIKKIYTSQKLIEKLKNQGTEFSETYENFVFLEQVSLKISLFTKIFSLIKSYIYPIGIYSEDYGEEAVILFTSGSETMPKAVLLTHENLLTNIEDVLIHINVNQNDSIIGFLPPFHSFGLTLNVILPVLSKIRVVYHSNPTEGGTIANLIKHYRASVLIGTPTFLSGILRSTDGEELKTLRFAVTGAEKCSKKIYKKLESICENVNLIEGYGVTECSPIISANILEKPVRQSIGKVMPSIEYIIIDVNTNKEVEKGKNGMLYVRGKSVFKGYVNYDGENPFTTIDNKEYYKTGDIVREEERILFFEARLKRFIKLGGEMISMPAIEEIITTHYLDEEDEGPQFAVDFAGNDQNSELILYTTKKVKREEINSLIKQAGLSSLHNIRRIEKINKIPILGTGKTDYKLLRVSVLDIDKVEQL
ncbi:MAG: AMP-binding protein [Candidatus Muirbacterium halophilum]|nr:AMP-binding protein [Candidatus Muirbacterium halophilum]MCK9476719.1 AMP-binding protein [Candidatus Muirbacterium halophilum]